MEDEIELSKSTGNSYRDIVMNQLNKVTNFCNVEFRGGFYTEVKTKDGGEKRVYIQDSREVFSNAVFALAIILKPRFSKEMLKDFREIIGNVKEIEQTFINASSVNETVILGESFYDDPKDKILLEECKMNKLHEYLRLFSKISKELSRLNYFEFVGGTF